MVEIDNKMANQGGVTLREATARDSGIVAALLTETFAHKFGRILGQSAAPILRDWFDLTQRHLNTTTLAEMAGQPIGVIMLALPNSPPADSDLPDFWRALRGHQPQLRAAWQLAQLWLQDGSYQPSRREVYIEMLGVHPHWRRRGIATRLLSQAEAVARSQQVNQLTLSVLRQNQAARQLYATCGFTPLREQPVWWLRKVVKHDGYVVLRKRVAD